jgi:hypothetical protein
MYSGYCKVNPDATPATQNPIQVVMRSESDPVFLVVNLKDGTMIQGLDPIVECFIGVFMILLAIVLLAVIVRSCIMLQIKETQRIKELKYHKYLERQEREQEDDDKIKKQAPFVIR